MDDVLQPIVVGVDGSEPSQRALAWAAQAAMTRDVPLAILYAAQGTHDVLQEAEAEARDRFPDLECSTEFSLENPAAALVDSSKLASMVVVGNRGHGGFHDLLLGSISLQVAMHAECPVAIVREVVTGEGGSPGRIVVGVDASLPSQAALAQAFAEAQLTGKPITAVHVFASALTAYPTGLMPQMPDYEADLARARDLLARELLAWQGKYPDVYVDAQVVQGSAAWILVQKSHGAHLVVAGSRGLGGFSGLMFGSVGHALIHHAGCPVLIAR